jgi:hypothetical protein
MIILMVCFSLFCRLLECPSFSQMYAFIDEDSLEDAMFHKPHTPAESFTNDVCICFLMFIR